MVLTAEWKTLCIDTANRLKGHARRRFLAQTVKALGPGGQRLAERELGWNRETIRKGLHELESGFRCIDATIFRRPKRADERLPTCSRISVRWWMAKVRPTRNFAPTDSICASPPPRFAAN